MGKKKSRVSQKRKYQRRNYRYPLKNKKKDKQSTSKETKSSSESEESDKITHTSTQSSGDHQDIQHFTCNGVCSLTNLQDTGEKQISEELISPHNDNFDALENTEDKGIILECESFPDIDYSYYATEYCDNFESFADQNEVTLTSNPILTDHSYTNKVKVEILSSNEYDDFAMLDMYVDGAKVDAKTQTDEHEIELSPLEKLGRLLNSELESKKQYLVTAKPDRLDIIELYDNPNNLDLCVKLSIVINVQFKAKIYIHRKEVAADHEVWHGLPKTFKNVQPIKDLLSKLMLFGVCIGNPDQELHFITPIGGEVMSVRSGVGDTLNSAETGSGISNETGSGFSGVVRCYREANFGACHLGTTYTSTIKNVNCRLLARSARCTLCAGDRKMLMSRKKTADKKKGPTDFIHTNYCHYYMNREMLLEKIRQQQAEMKTMSSEISKLKKQVKKMGKNGVKSVSSESEDIVPPNEASKGQKTKNDDLIFDKLWNFQTSSPSFSNKDSNTFQPSSEKISISNEVHLPKQKLQTSDLNVHEQFNANSKNIHFYHDLEKDQMQLSSTGNSPPIEEPSMYIISTPEEFSDELPLSLNQVDNSRQLPLSFNQMDNNEEELPVLENSENKIPTSQNSVIHQLHPLSGKVSEEHVPSFSEKEQEESPSQISIDQLPISLKEDVTIDNSSHSDKLPSSFEENVKPKTDLNVMEVQKDNYILNLQTSVPLKNSSAIIFTDGKNIIKFDPSKVNNNVEVQSLKTLQFNKMESLFVPLPQMKKGAKLNNDNNYSTKSRVWHLKNQAAKPEYKDLTPGNTVKFEPEQLENKHPDGAKVMGVDRSKFKGQLKKKRKNDADKDDSDGAKKKKMNKIAGKTTSFRRTNIIKVNECVECGETFPCLIKLKKHKREAHGPICRVCGLNTFNLSAEEHEKIHKEKRTNQCEICGSFHKNLYQLKQHMTLHTKEKNYVCETCGKCFRTQKNLKYHSVIHTDSCVTCEICGKKIKHAPNLRRHMMIHTGRLYKCNVCGKAFDQKNKLMDHLNIHSGDKPFKCDKCDAKFFSREHLKKHIVIKHEGKTPHYSYKRYVSYKFCDLCEKFFTKNNFTAHYRQHTGYRPFECLTCKKRFTSKLLLEHHKEIHDSSKRNNVCDICGKVYKSKVLLSGHKKYIHAMKEQGDIISCKLCGIEFSWPNNLRRHMRKFHGK